MQFAVSKQFPVVFKADELRRMNAVIIGESKQERSCKGIERKQQESRYKRRYQEQSRILAHTNRVVVSSFFHFLIFSRYEDIASYISCAAV